MAKRLWQVEWISEMPEDEFGDADIDRAKYSVTYCATEGEARKLAGMMAPESYWGVATIRPFEQISKETVLADDEGELEYWIEKGNVYAYVGDSQEVQG